jgi:signal transduction histidine kinase/ActR/RegA family two-component response regulator
VIVPDSAVLIGRSRETGRITEAIEAGIRRIVITGDAGVGKSAMAHKAAHILRGHRALVGAGKHASGETGAGPLFRAMRQLIDEALEELYEPAAGLEQLRSAMGPAQALFDEIMLSRAMPLAAIRDAEARVEQLAQMLELTIRWLGGFGVPLVILIDDWDRATEDVGRLYLRALDVAIAVPVYLIVTGRTWQPCLPSDLPEQLALSLAGLEPAGRLELLASQLGEDGAARLDALLPGTVTRPLDLIQRADAVALHLEQGNTWTDPETIAAALQDDLPAMIALQLARLSAAARDLALLASMLGDMTDLEVLRAASGLGPAHFEPAIDVLVRAGLIARADASIRFQHDTIRAAVAGSAPTIHLQEIAIAAAQRLMPLFADEPAIPMALEALLLAHPPESAERQWVAPLLRGAELAMRSLDIDRASRLASLAIRMDGGLEVADQSTLTLCAMTKMVAGDLDFVVPCVAQLRTLATSREDIAFAYGLSATAARARGDRAAAIRFSLQGHRLLGWKIPDTPSSLSTRLDVVWTNLAGDVFRAIPMRAYAPDQDIVALSAITSTIFYEYGSPHVVAVARHFALSRATRNTSAGLSAAVFMANFMGRNRLASQLGGRILEEGRSAEPNWAPSAYRGNFFGRLWTRPARSFEKVHDDLHAHALAEGDLLVAAWIVRSKAHLHWRAGDPLAKVEQLAQQAREFAQRVGNQTSAAAAAQIWLAARLLQGHDADPQIRIDPYCPHTLETPLLTWLAYHNLRGDFQQTLDILANVPRKPGIGATSHPGVRDFRFHRAVAMLMVQGKCWPEDIRAIGRAAKLCPGDNGGRILILRALIAKRRSKHVLAHRLLIDALQTSLTLGRPHEASLAGILAADLATARDRGAEATAHIEQARRAWLAWGASIESHVRLRPVAGSGTMQHLEQMARRLEQSERESRAKSRLLALVGHELRTPLQAMSGAVDLIHADSSQIRDLSIVTASIDRLSAMVDDLSAVTALEAGELTVNPRAFNLAVMLRSVLDTHADALAAVGMSLLLDAPPDTQAWLFGDDKRLQQILDNLLNNARKYGAGEVLLKVSQDDDHWSFEVADEGPGLMPEQVVRVFEPFVRGASAGASPGHGIGLWLARKLAENMGGQLVLAAADTTKTSARFILTLPLSAANQPDTIVSAQPGGPKTVILIEDEPLSRDVLQRMLAVDGHDVTAFETGHAALACLAASPHIYDFAFVDGNLPDMNGLEIATRIRALPQLLVQSVILITAHVTHDHVHSQRTGVVDMVIQKPVNLGMIRKIVGLGTQQPLPGIDTRLDAAARIHFSTYLQAIESSFESAAWRDLEAQAHKLAGAALIHDLDDLGAAALELESFARKENRQGAGDTIGRIHQFYANLAAGNQIHDPQLLSGIKMISFYGLD